MKGTKGLPKKHTPATATLSWRSSRTLRAAPHCARSSAQAGRGRAERGGGWGNDAGNLRAEDDHAQGHPCARVGCDDHGLGTGDHRTETGHRCAEARHA